MRRFWKRTGSTEREFAPAQDSLANMPALEEKFTARARCKQCSEVDDSKRMERCSNHGQKLIDAEQRD